MTLSLTLVAKTIDALGGRRCAVTIGCGVVTTAVLAAHLIGETTYGTIIISTVGAYIGGNTYQQVKSTNAK